MPIRRTSTRRSWPVSRFPECRGTVKAGNIPTAVAGRPLAAASFRRPILTPRSLVPQSSATTPNGRVINASRRVFRSLQWRADRAGNCDVLISRLRQLADANPPLVLPSHPVTKELAEKPSPGTDAAYKHREDLIDALLCAWTASLWARHGFSRCQVLGLPANASQRARCNDHRPRTPRAVPEVTT